MLPRVDSLRSRNALRSNQSNSASCESQNDSAGKSGGTSLNSSAASEDRDGEWELPSASATCSQAILRSLAVVQEVSKASRSTGGGMAEKEV